MALGSVELYWETLGGPGVYWEILGGPGLHWETLGHTVPAATVNSQSLGSFAQFGAGPVPGHGIGGSPSLSRPTDRGHKWEGRRGARWA